MQELALLISSLAGAASAVAVHKIPRGPRMPTIGASGRVRGEIQTLENERGLLDKAVARLYDGGGIPEAKRDALLQRYQVRLSEIHSRIQDLKAAGSHPDLGPVGDSLIVLMDQKLSSLDARLHEISAKMQAPRQEKPAPEKPAAKPRPEKRAPQPEPPNDKALDMVTLTVHPAAAASVSALAGSLAKPAAPETVAQIPPAAQAPQLAREQAPPAALPPEAAEPRVPAQVPAQAEAKTSEPAARPEVEPQVPAQAGPQIRPADAKPETEDGEYDDESLDSLKKDILTALEQIEQTEVE